VVFLFALQAALILYFVCESRFLYGDGSNFFTAILRSQDFVDGGRRAARSYANVFTQLPLVGALRLGVRDVDLLRTIYGASLFFPYLLCMSVWVWATKEEPRFLLFPALLLFAGASNSLFFVISESHVAGALVFTLVALLLFRRRWGPGTILLSGLLALPLLRAYESMVFFGPLLGGLAMGRARRAPGRMALVGWIVLTGWFLAGALVALMEITAPTSTVPINVSTFVDQAMFLLRDKMLPILWGETDVHYSAILSLLALPILCVGFCLSPGAARAKAAVIGVYGAMCLLVLIALACFPELMEVPLHYHARVFNVVIPVLLILTLLLFHFAPRLRSSFDWRYAFVLVALLGTYQLGWQGLATGQWAGYLDVFRDEVTQNEGYVPFEASSLNTEKRGRQAIDNMNYGWALPTMSILLAKDREVRAIVGPTDEGAWQPFDPREPEALPDFAEYGLSYEPYLRRLHSDAPGESD
jgi:hypothetical protein